MSVCLVLDLLVVTLMVEVESVGFALDANELKIGLSPFEVAC